MSWNTVVYLIVLSTLLISPSSKDSLLALAGIVGLALIMAFEGYAEFVGKK